MQCMHAPCIPVVDASSTASLNLTTGKQAKQSKTKKPTVTTATMRDEEDTINALVGMAQVEQQRTC